MKEKNYKNYTDFVIVQFLLKNGYEIDTIARILYGR